MSRPNRRTIDYDDADLLEGIYRKAWGDIYRVRAIINARSKTINVFLYLRTSRHEHVYDEKHMYDYCHRKTGEYHQWIAGEYQDKG